MGTRTDQLPLGKAGGYLASVIHDNPQDIFPLPGGTTTLDFAESLNSWLKYLGLAKEGVTSTPDSHYGFRLTIDGRPLRSVGTGVSQVLPVVAICLLAPIGGLVLLEEPELHLNPTVQQLLAEFFLEMCKSGRQIIVETHSEYLITRLRLKAIEFPEDNNLFSFIFTERDFSLKEPITTFKTVKPDQNGELPPWPAGYFDQVGKDIKALISNLADKKFSS